LYSQLLSHVLLLALFDLALNFG